MWLCPNCQKPFKNPRQLHSCNKFPADKHFEKRPEELKKIYTKIISHVNKLGPYHVNSVPYGIILKTVSAFLSVTIKKDHLVIGFFSDEKHDFFPVFKTLQVSKNRISHSVAVESCAELDEQILNWIKQSYSLISEKKKKIKKT